MPGDLSRRIALNTGDELEALARQFNHMADRLAEARAGLEKRVAERTEELAEKSAQLEAASSHKSQFLANMSHELRTPLNAILGFTELLLDGIYGPIDDKKQQVLTRLKANGDHLLGLINDVLDLSKIEAGELSLSIARYELAAVIQSVLASAEPLAAAKGLSIDVGVPIGLQRGVGDERRIRQVLLNVVGNAIKFTNDGSIGISVEETNGRHLIRVTDSGAGIPPNDLTRVFEEFQQAGNSERTGGTGLGLSISRRIIELHGGWIEVESALGVGSTFTVVLPITAPGSHQREAEQLVEALGETT